MNEKEFKKIFGFKYQSWYKVKYSHVKICGKDINGQKFKIICSPEKAQHYNTVNANYWQKHKVINKITDAIIKEKYVLMFNR